MPFVELTDEDRRFLRIAFEEAKTGFEEGGVPVGAVLASDGTVLARGRNRLAQECNPILHGETDCLRQAGRHVDFSKTTLYTSLSPCSMCAGAVILFGIPKVVVGENVNFTGELDWLLDRGVSVALANDQEMIDYFQFFMHARPDLWSEDIVGYHK